MPSSVIMQLPFSTEIVIWLLRDTEAAAYLTAVHKSCETGREV